MELRVQLKVCEGCGCLWYRTENQETVYCRGCENRLSEFPAPTRQRRRRAPSRKAQFRLDPAEYGTGGGQ
jgi:hypothetical protein